MAERPMTQGGGGMDRPLSRPDTRHSSAFGDRPATRTVRLLCCEAGNTSYDDFYAETLLLIIGVSYMKT